MSTFSPAALPQVAPYDPTKHVNYSVGMVLGVDDFTQEFTYLAARDQQAIRTLDGYGVAWGLRVSVEDVAEKGPRVMVAPGVATTPSGRILCVSPAQCAYLNEWLAAHVREVEGLASPPPAEITLAVVACYRQCPTDDVPIPGEPCRTEEELMAPSRLQDSFALDLRLSAPAQTEEDGVRDFVAWLRQIPRVSGAAPSVEAMLASLRARLELGASPPESPPATALDLLLTAPPAEVEIPAAREGEYLRALLRFWIEELRPRLRGCTPGAECDCASADGQLDSDADCVLLAELRVPVALEAPTGRLLVADAPAVTVDEATRPALLHLRLLQELIVGGGLATSTATSVGGLVNAAGAVVASNGGLAARTLRAGLYVLNFPGFNPNVRYSVLGQPIAKYDQAAVPKFDFISSTDPGLLASLGGEPPPAGVVVRVGYPGGEGAIEPCDFVVRIDELGGAV
jgi:hypothetical protein